MAADGPWTRACALHARLLHEGGRRRRAGRALRGLAPLIPFPPSAETAAPPAPPPRIIWTYWHSGEAEAPPLVRTCIDSWRERNPRWEVVVLDEGSAAGRLGGTKPPANARAFANLLRLELLAREGGAWTDATVLCARPLDDWLPACLEQEGFFAFRHLAGDRPLASWFLASRPGDRTARVWARGLRTLQRLRPADAERRQAMHRLFAWTLSADRGVRAAWDRVPRLHPWPDGPAHEARARRGAPPALQAWLRDGRDPELRALAAGALADPRLPAHKLDWRIENGGARLHAALAELATS